MTDKPRIIVIGTGGTIAGTGASPTDGAYEPGKIGTDDLIDAVSGLTQIAEIEAESLFSHGSEDLGPEQWWVLAQRVQALSEKKRINGIVITHGTDTLEEAAFFLDLVLAPKTPVVFTAALRPATALSADGPANINQAVLTAAALAGDKAHNQVHVVMNGLVLAGWQTIKTNSLSLGAFDAFPGGPVARVTRNRLMPSGKFPLSPIHGAFKNLLKQAPALEPVPIVYLSGGVGADVLNFGKKPPKGMVIAGFGAGTMPQAVYDQAYETAQKDCVVVVSSRVCETTVLPETSRVRRASGMIASGFLNPQKAAILLKLALVSGMDNVETPALFRQLYEVG